MFFSIGIETPKNKNEAFGLIVPALCDDNYSCFSAADSQADIPVMATEAILFTIQDMLDSGKYNINDIKNNHFLYQKNDEYKEYDTWLVINVDISELLGKPKRINISLPDVLIERIDNAVKAKHYLYKDRSNFLAQAAESEINKMQV